MKGWLETELGKEIDLKTGFPFKSALYSDKPTDVRLLRGDNIVQGTIRWDDVQRWPKYDVDDYEDYFLAEGDVMLAMDRPWIEAGLKHACLRKADVPCLQVQRTARLRGKGRLRTDYLRYIIAENRFTRYVKQVNTGSNVPHISAGQIREFPIVIPSEGTQKQIAKVLSTLDVKIELNNRINEELEELAKLLYDYWFLQFDFPISAAQAAAMGDPALEGKPYRQSGGKMVFNQTLKREIPDGWSPRHLSEITTVTKETVTPSKTPKAEFRLFSIPGYDATGTFLVKHGCEIGSNKFLVTGSDLLVSKLNPWTSRIIYPEAGTDAVCSTEFVVWNCSASWMKAFLYMVASGPHFRAYCSQSASGTSNSHKRVNPSVMMDYAVPYDEATTEKFGKIVDPLLLKRQMNQKQNQHLTELRDWLLPMLMNGQVTVGDAS